MLEFKFDLSTRTPSFLQFRRDSPLFESPDEETSPSEPPASGPTKFSFSTGPGEMMMCY